MAISLSAIMWCDRPSEFDTVASPERGVVFMAFIIFSRASCHVHETFWIEKLRVVLRASRKDAARQRDSETFSATDQI